MAGREGNKSVFGIPIKVIKTNRMPPVPPRIARHRTIWSVSIFTTASSGAYYLLIYFIPMYFQAIKGTTALRSGINSIPLILCNVVGSLMSGFLTTKTGYYMPFIYITIICTCISSGLLTTLTPTTSTAAWTGYQILYGFGSGCGFQLPPIAAQTVLPGNDVQTGIAVTLFFQNFGGALFVSIGNNVLNELLLQYVSALEVDLGGTDAFGVVQAGATAIRDIVPPTALDAVVGAYMSALTGTFRVALVLSCLSTIGGVFMEWRSVKESSQGVGMNETEAEIDTA
jgi:MFS family permease